MRPGQEGTQQQRAGLSIPVLSDPNPHTLMTLRTCRKNNFSICFRGFLCKCQPLVWVYHKDRKCTYGKHTTQYIVTRSPHPRNHNSDQETGHSWRSEAHLRSCLSRPLESPLPWLPTSGIFLLVLSSVQGKSDSVYWFVSGFFQVCGDFFNMSLLQTFYIIAPLTRKSLIFPSATVCTLQNSHWK